MKSKFTEEEALTLRAMYMEGATQHELAELMGVRQSTICKLINGDTYINVPKPAIRRRCADCHKPMQGRRKRCPKCQAKWQDIYFRQWYEQRKAEKKQGEGA